MECMSTMKGENFRVTLESVFPVIRKELNQAQRKTMNVSKEFNKMSMVRIKNTFEHVKVKVLPKPYEQTNEERQSHEATHCPFRAWCEVCVKAKSLDGKHAKQVENPENFLVIEFDSAFATDTLGGPKISMMVVIDSIHGSIFAVVARRKGSQDEYVMQSFQNYTDRLGLVKEGL